MIFKKDSFFSFTNFIFLSPSISFILLAHFAQIINRNPISLPNFQQSIFISCFQNLNNPFNCKPLYSLVLSTYNRYHCFAKLIPKLLESLPNYTELIISDDGSNEINKINLLNSIYKKSQKCRNSLSTVNSINSSLLPYCNVYITRHDKSYGSFHTKLDGFLFARGQFIMTIDDDDDFDSNYYKEMVEVMEKYRNITNQIDGYDFFITKNNFYRKYIKKSSLNSIHIMIRAFHNHVAYAFRRSLLLNVEYPPHSYTILRDDAPLMIPLYMQTTMDRILFYDNKCKYHLNRNCRFVVHQRAVLVRPRNKELRLNGLRFLLDWMKKANLTQYEADIRKAY